MEPVSLLDDDSEATSLIPLESTIPHFMNSLLSQVSKESRENDGKLSSDLLSSLQAVFGAALLPALDLVDRRAVCHMTSTSGRELHVYRVTSGSNSYICVFDSASCSCPSFTYGVLVRGDMLLCKHLLAVQLSRALGTVSMETVDDRQFALLLSGRSIN